MNGVVYDGSENHHMYAFDLAGGQAGVIPQALARLHPDDALRPDHG